MLSILLNHSSTSYKNKQTGLAQKSTEQIHPDPAHKDEAVHRNEDEAEADHQKEDDHQEEDAEDTEVVF